MAVGLVACDSDSNNSAVVSVQSDPVETTPEVIPTPTFIIGLLPDTQGGHDDAGLPHVALHPLKKVLAHQEAAGVNMVLALGDLTKVPN